MVSTDSEDIKNKNKKYSTNSPFSLVGFLFSNFVLRMSESLSELWKLVFHCKFKVIDYICIWTNSERRAG